MKNKRYGTCNQTSRHQNTCIKRSGNGIIDPLHLCKEAGPVFFHSSDKPALTNNLMLRKTFECRLYLLNNSAAVQSNAAPQWLQYNKIGETAIMTQSWGIEFSRLLQSSESKQTNENVRKKIHSIPRRRKWPTGGLSDIQRLSIQIKASLERPTERDMKRNKILPDMTFIRPMIMKELSLGWKWRIYTKLIFVRR